MFFFDGGNMIKIIVKEKKEIISIEIQGHANYAEYGKDIVCAAVSVLYQTLMIHLEKMKICMKSDNKENKRLTIYENNKEIKLLIDHFIIGINAIEKAYPNYVKHSCIRQSKKEEMLV